ncbi:MAG: hypothetical protein IPG23_24910 [Burkholderiales bacterium]|nr:hypothetical protein [Burkholderiales bacterium]
MNAKERTPKETLLRVLYFDVRKRYQILDEECQHLLQSTNFRDTAVVGKFPDSQQAFCKRLASAAQLLFDECQADWREIRAYKEQTENRWKNQQSNEEKQRQIQNATAAYSRNGFAFLSPKFRLHHFDLIWHAKMMFKASLIAERIGDLHDRLAQLLQRTNPDHPDPTVRRRAEQGSIDKYLTEQTRWVHRDIARFAISVGTKYPYSEVPATFQSWEYDYTSRHHSFMPSASYACWTEWHRGDQSKRIAPKKFASLRLSYWMTERMPLHPIIGHEIAHQVLRDSFGHILSHSRLESEEGQIARLFRRLVRCNEDWLARRPGVNAAAEAENISVEIVCDLLAAVRYGYAYAFAWILEIVGDENLAHLFDDETSMLQRFWTDEVSISAANNNGDTAIQSPPPTVNLEDLRDNFLWGTQRLEQGLPKAYYRGYVLMHFLL